MLYRWILEIHPDNTDALHLLGLLAQQAGKFDMAADLIVRAVAVDPHDPSFHNNLGVVLRLQGKVREAIASFRRAVALQPQSAEACSNLGGALRDQGEHEKAIEVLRQAVSLEPNHAEARNNLGGALSDAGQPREALGHFTRALQLQPDHADAHFGAALVRLLEGDLGAGFTEYEWRWRCQEFAGGLRGFAQPPWDGGALEGRTILLHAEQGLGDTLQFARYAPLVAARGGRVVLEAQRELAPLLRSLAGAERVVARGVEPLPPFDVHAPLLSLPHLLGTTLGTIPAAVPYLRADPERAAAWAEYLAAEVGERAGTLRVGLVWAGNPDHKGDRRRSLPLATLAPLGRVPGVRLVGLQKGPAAAQADVPPAGLALTNLGPLLADFADTAAVLEQLDLVIAVDTAVAHLAGALGRPVWLLLPFAPDWRWLRARTDSPWYPTMRLFRQDAPAAWDPLLLHLADALATHATDHRRLHREQARRTTVVALQG